MRRRPSTSAARRKPCRSPRPLDHFLIGKELYQRGEWAAALPHFDTALSRQPGTSGPTACRPSAACSSSGRSRPRPSSRLPQTEPGFAWLYELRGFASYQIAGLARAAAENLQAKGGTLRAEIELQLKAAEADYSRALELLDAAPTTSCGTPSWSTAGCSGSSAGSGTRRCADLQAAIRLDDRQWQAFEILAQVTSRQDKPDQAIEQFTRAIALRPDWAPLYRARARCEPGARSQTPAQRARALADLEQAIRLEPPGSPFLALDHTNRARLLHREGREEEALAACEAALKVDPDYLDAHRLRIEVLRKLKRHDEVIRSCDALLTRGKPSAELYELRGLAKEKLKDYQGAIEDQTLAIALHPGTAALLARRGGLLPGHRRAPLGVA